MKKISTAVCALMIFMTCTACGQSGGEDIVTEETARTEWNGGPPKNIINTDFRNIVWGMSPTEIEYQEQRVEDFFGDYLMYYDDIKFAGFDSRLYYYFEEGWQCSSAAYFITLSADSPFYDTAYYTIDTFITEIFAPPDEEGSSVRTTANAVIELISADTDCERIISVKFSKPEDHDDEKYHSKVIYFDSGEPVGSTVIQ